MSFGDQLKQMKAAISAGDHEKAHCIENEIHRETLRQIASGECGDAAELAKQALKTLKLKFDRYCA